MPEHQQIQQSKKPDTIFQKQAIPISQTPVSNPYSIIQRAKINPKSLIHADIMQLQRTIGNQAVGRLLSSIGNSSTAQQATVQRQEIPEEEKACPTCMQRQEIPEEEEPLQGKMIGTIQRQEISEEEEPLQPLQGKMIGTVQRQEIPEEEEPLQTKRENNTGMPDNLKAGVESLSGIDMSDVRVHYSSEKPTEVGALAYTQGTNIHVAPGQERHLPHEAWHVVQQKQGRVKPTMQLKGGIPVNDDKRLEHEADGMGTKAFMSGQELITNELIHVVQQTSMPLHHAHPQTEEPEFVRICPTANILQRTRPKRPKGIKRDEIKELKTAVENKDGNKFKEIAKKIYKKDKKYYESLQQHEVEKHGKDSLRGRIWLNNSPISKSKHKTADAASPLSSRKSMSNSEMNSENVSTIGFSRQVNDDSNQSPKEPLLNSDMEEKSGSDFGNVNDDPNQSFFEQLPLPSSESNKSEFPQELNSEKVSSCGYQPPHPKSKKDVGHNVVNLVDNLTPSSLLDVKGTSTSYQSGYMDPLLTSKPYEKYKEKTLRHNATEFVIGKVADAVSGIPISSGFKVSEMKKCANCLSKIKSENPDVKNSVRYFEQELNNMSNSLGAKKTASAITGLALKGVPVVKSIASSVAEKLVSKKPDEDKSIEDDSQAMQLHNAVLLDNNEEALKAFECLLGNKDGKIMARDKYGYKSLSDKIGKLRTM